MDDIRRMYEAYLRGEENGVEDLGSINDYGLSFEYVPGEHDERGFWRWLISWGGPSEEFRFYGESLDEYKSVLDRIQFRFHDWFDGAGQEIPLTSEDGKLLAGWFNDLAECGTVHYARNQAIDALS